MCFTSTDENRRCYVPTSQTRRKGLGWLTRTYGAPVDLVQAYKWLDLATVAHYPTWDKPGGKEAAEIRDRIASVMTAMQIVEARTLARERKPK
jgi:uncharacterized protein